MVSSKKILFFWYIFAFNEVSGQIPIQLSVDYNYFHSFNKKELKASGYHTGFMEYNFNYSNEQGTFGSDYSIELSWLLDDAQGVGLVFGETTFSHLTDVRISTWSDDFSFTDNFYPMAWQRLKSLFLGLNYFIEKPIGAFNFRGSSGFNLYDFGFASYLGYLNKFREKYIAGSIKIGFSKCIHNRLDLGFQLKCNNYLIPLEEWNSNTKGSFRFTDGEFKPIQLGVGLFVTYNFSKK